MVEYFDQWLPHVLNLAEFFIQKGVDINALDEKGFAALHEAIGIDFYNGFRVEKDIEKAVVWFQRAAAHGHKEALEMLERIRRENEKRDPDHG